MHVISSAKRCFLEILDQYLLSHGRKLDGLLKKMVSQGIRCVVFVRLIHSV